MNKYIVILSIIIVLYFVQKYCIQSEVEKFLLTKNIIEKFAAGDIATLNGLNISGNIILGNKIVITSDISGLKMLDGNTGNAANLSVNNIDISGTLTMQSGINFTGDNNRFTRDNAELRINSGENNSVSIRSTNGPLILNGPDISNKIILGGNIDISGLFTINNVAPILTKVFIDPATTQPTSRLIPTFINAIDYPSITFSGYDNNSTSPGQYANIIEFNTYVDPDSKKWFISLTPQITQEIKIRVTFFHKNLVDNQVFTLEPPTIAVSAFSNRLVLTMTRPTNFVNTTTTYTATAINTSSSVPVPLNQIVVNNSTITISGLTMSTNYTVTVTALNGDYTSLRTQTFTTGGPVAPEAITDLTVVRAANGDIISEFTPPISSTPITNYTWQLNVYTISTGATIYGGSVILVPSNLTTLANGKLRYTISGVGATPADKKIFVGWGAKNSGFETYGPQTIRELL